MNTLSKLKEEFYEELPEMLTGHCISADNIVEEKGVLWRMRPSYIKFVRKILWSFIHQAYLSGKEVGFREGEKEGRRQQRWDDEPR